MSRYRLACFYLSRSFWPLVLRYYELLCIVANGNRPRYHSAVQCPKRDIDLGIRLQQNSIVVAKVVCCSKTGRLSYRTHSQVVCTKTVVCGKARIIMQHTNPHPQNLWSSTVGMTKLLFFYVTLAFVSKHNICIKTPHLLQNTGFVVKHTF